MLQQNRAWHFLLCDIPLCDVSIAVVWTEPGGMNTLVGALLKTSSLKVLVRQLN